MPQAQQFERTQVYNYRIGKNIENAARLKFYRKSLQVAKLCGLTLRWWGRGLGKPGF